MSESITPVDDVSLSEVDGTTGSRQGLVHVHVPRRGGAPAPTVAPDRRGGMAADLKKGYRRRKMTNSLMLGFAVVCAVVALIPLLTIAYFVISQGITSLNLSFFIHAQSDVDAAGDPLGIGNTIAGTLLLIAVACLVGLPVGLFSGIYLAEYGRGRFAGAVRFLADVIAGLPSIVAGLVGYALIVVYFGYSAVAGGIALGLLMFPVVTRATEEVLRLVPHSLREGALALGIPRWRVIARVVVPTAANGIITSMLLGVARVTGETAPLVFTTFSNNYWNWNPMRPVGALTYMIYDYTTNYTRSDPQYPMALAGALVLIAIVVGLNLTARLLFRQRVRGQT